MRQSPRPLALRMLNPHTEANLRFQLGEEIGTEGKNSTVFHAHDLQLDADLAIKRVRKDSMDDIASYYREASILYLSDHANVVPIHYACEDDEFIYLAMPYFSLGSLNKVLEQRFLTVREIVRYSIQFLSGLHNIHSKGLIHFDIKPDNIMLSNRNEALVSDFGLAQKMHADGKALQLWTYWKNIPPEALLENEHTPAFDVYQVGLTLYRMCCGNATFYEQFGKYKTNDEFAIAVHTAAFPDRNKFPAHIPNALRTVVKKCLALSVNERYPAVIEVANALASLDGNELDWSYTVDADGTRTWTRSDDERTFTLTVTADGNSTATRTTERSTSKMKNWCVNPIDEKTIRRFLKEV